MRKTKRRHRWLALALCLSMPVGVFPLSGMTCAEEQGCSHVHDDASGPVTAKRVIRPALRMRTSKPERAAACRCSSRTRQPTTSSTTAGRRTA